MAAALVSRPPEAPSYPKKMPPHTHACPKCGTAYPYSQDQNTEDNIRRIAELESQVRILTDKATAAVDKLADYEDELRRIKTSHNANRPKTPSDSNLNAPRTSDEEGRPSSSQAASKASRFSSLLGRRASPAQPAPPVPPPLNSASDADLQAALAREQRLRQEAENKVKDMSGEIEDLSVQLFQQANEMVATERKARAKLEERVEVLERRDDEKRKRLERLEGAMKRIERVRGLLAG